MVDGTLIEAVARMAWATWRTARNGKYDIVRQAGMDLVKIHHDLENEKPPQPMAQKSAAPLNYQQFPSSPLRSPAPLALKWVPPARQFPQKPHFQPKN